MSRTRVFLLLACTGFLGLALHAAEQELSAAPQQANAPQAAGQGSDRANYVGDAACLSCHRDISLSYRNTPHHLTSQLANRSSVLGSFRAPSNEIKITDPEDASLGMSLSFKMEAKDDGFYETAHEATAVGGAPQVQTQSERIDIVTGSGTRGQTYLYWHGNQLYELPVSYWSSLHQWINSPGYRNGTADFSRPIYPRCLECHAAYIRPLSSDPLTNSYDKQSFVAGISCETCHGPGAAHIEMEKQKMEKQTNASPTAAAPVDPHILNPARFVRDRQVDLCALCHNGSQRVERAPAFTYIPGSPLDDYLRPEAIAMPTHPDVHGNQVGLLERSLCYRSSPGMSCLTCHDVHAPAKSLASYSQRCLTCHQVESCGMAKTMGRKIANDCIDCHMPVQPTSAIVSQTGDKITRASMRTHWIKVYRNDAQLSREPLPRHAR